MILLVVGLRWCFLCWRVVFFVWYVVPVDCRRLLKLIVLVRSLTGCRLCD